MSKRLTRSDYLITLTVILLIFCCIGAFFVGLKVGKDNTEQKYKVAAAKEELPAELTAYHQQYLVSFYHTIFQPFRDFQKSWFTHMDSLELRSNTTDTASVFKELDKLAKQYYNEILHKGMPDTSPLLQRAHEDYLKSLKLFSEAIKEAKYKKLQGLELMTEIEHDVFFQEAKQFALSAQSHYYDAIVKWHQSIDPSIQSIQTDGELISFDTWVELSLNEKNNIISSLIEAGKFFEPYDVQDVTLRVDELIIDGLAEKMQLTNVNEVMITLINTRAIRSGDFINSKDRYYQDELLPQLPFFYE